MPLCNCVCCHLKAAPSHDIARLGYTNSDSTSIPLALWKTAQKKKTTPKKEYNLNANGGWGGMGMRDPSVELFSLGP